METSINILVNEIWESPDWAVRHEDQLEISPHPRIRINIALTGLGGSAAFLKLQDGSSLQFGGAPMYNMEESMHKDLTFVAQLVIDLFYLLEDVRSDKNAVGDKELSRAIANAVVPLMLFLQMAMEQRPELIQKKWWKHSMEALTNAGLKLNNK